MRNDGKQDQAVLMVAANTAEFAAGPGRVLIDPNGLRGDATVSLADYVPSPDGRWLAYALRSGFGLDHLACDGCGYGQGPARSAARHQIHARVLGARRVRRSTTAPIPAATTSCRRWCAGIAWVRTSRHRGSRGVRVRDHSTRVPYGEVSEDGRYLVITLRRRRHSATASWSCRWKVALPSRCSCSTTANIPTWDRELAVGTELLFQTTAGAANGRVVAVDLGKFDPASRVRSSARGGA